MPNSTIRPFAPNGGPSSQTPQGTVYDGPAITPGGGTVYGGPTTNGAVYGGPAPAGTVHSPTRQNAAQGAATAQAKSATKGAGIFFLVAGFSVINTLLTLAHAPFVLALGLAVTRTGTSVPIPTVVVLNVIAVGLFALLGIFVRNGSKAALVIGMLLYAADTALLLLGGNAALHIPSIIVHAIFILSMFRAFSASRG